MSAEATTATADVVAQTKSFPVARVVQGVLAVFLIALLVLDVFPPIKPVAAAALIVLVVITVVGLLDQLAPARVTDAIATGLIWFFAGVIVLLLASFLIYIVVRGLSVISLDFLSSSGEGSIGSQLWNSFYLLIITMIISIPLGVGAGIYMAEFAPVNRLTEGIRLATETLASLPSIIVGLFGLIFFVQTFNLSFSVLAGALALAVFNLPVMERVTEQSLRAVPSSLREGALGLGMTRWQAIRTVILPTAIPGLVTGFVLAAGRVFGEAAALLFTAGQSTTALNWSDINFFNNTSPIGLLRPAESLAVHIWKLQSEGIVKNYRGIADGAAAILIIAVLLFNVAARYLGRTLYRRITASR